MATKQTYWDMYLSVSACTCVGMCKGFLKGNNLVNKPSDTTDCTERERKRE